MIGDAILPKEDKRPTVPGSVWTVGHLQCSHNEARRIAYTPIEATVIEVKGLGKMFGPAGLALKAGSSNVVNPRATIAAPTLGFFFLACVAALACCAHLILGTEIKGRFIEEIHDDLQIKGRRIAVS